MSQNKNIVPGYTVTQDGEVFSDTGKGPYHKQLTNRGYYQVRLQTGKGDRRGREAFLVHRMVAETHLPNPKKLPQVNHINGDKLDNRLDNLEWVTAKGNMQHAVKTGLYRSPRAQTGKLNELHHRSRAINQLTKTGEFVHRFPSIQEAGRAGFHVGNITSALKGRYKSTGGFKWEYA